MADRPGSLLRTALLFYCATALVAWIWAALWGDLALLAGPRIPTAGDLLIGLLTGLVIVALCHFAAALFLSVQRASHVLASFFGPITPVQAVLLALLSGLSEELLFRGALWPQLGLAGTTILFAILHVIPVRGLQGYPLFAALAALVFGLLRSTSGSVWPPALAHATVNALNLAYLGALERRRLATEPFALPAMPPRAALEAPPDPLTTADLGLDSNREPTFPVTVWRYDLRLELEGTDRETLPSCLEHEQLSLFEFCPRESVYAQLREGQLLFRETFEEPLRAFPEDLATLSTYLFQPVAGLEVAERYRDPETTDDVRAWRVLAQRGEWVKVPLVVAPPKEGRFEVDDEQYDLEVMAARWKEFPRWFQDAMRFRYPSLRDL